MWATRSSSDLTASGCWSSSRDDMDGPGAPKVTPVIAVDPVGADLGEHVVVAFGKAARVACGGDGDLAYEAAVVGIVDDVHAPGAPESWRPEAARGRV